MASSSKQQLPVELTSEHYQMYRQAFELFDKDGDDSITVNEVGLVMGELGMAPSKDELAGLVKTFDLNRNGKIEFNEFVTKMDRRQSLAEEEKELKEAFRVFDKDGNGFICRDELCLLMHAIGENLSELQIDALLAEADLDGDQLVSFEEFVQMMNKNK